MNGLLRVTLARTTPALQLKYLARVELIKRQDRRPNYLLLGKLMMQAGFRRTVRISDGRFCRLPKATFIIKTDQTMKAVGLLAEAAAKATGSEAHIIIVEVSRVAVAGLLPATDEEIAVWHKDPLKVTAEI